MAPTYDHTISYDQATFLGFALEAIFYGINLVLFGIAIAVLWGRNSANNARSNLGMIIVTCWMFSLCTTHFGLNFNNVYNGTMVRPVEHISNETHLLAGADMLFSITDWCSQLILIYRCYLVWGNNIWVVLVPILISLATVSCGLALIGLVLTINPSAAQAPAAIVPVGTAGFSLSLCLNFIVSALIVGRIWYISRKNRQHGVVSNDTAIQRAIGIIVESGLLFLAIQFVFLVLFSIKHPAQDLVEPIATQIYGISPTLIIVRVGVGASFDPSTSARGSSSLRSGGGARARPPRSKLLFRVTGTDTGTSMSMGTHTTDRTRAPGVGYAYDVEMDEASGPVGRKEASSLSLPN